MARVVGFGILVLVSLLVALADAFPRVGTAQRNAGAGAARESGGSGRPPSPASKQQQQQKKETKKPGTARTASTASARRGSGQQQHTPRSVRKGVLEDPASQLTYRLARDAKEECSTPLDGPSQSQPPRDGVIRPGLSREGREDGRLLALLQRTGAEHHASALLALEHHHGSSAHRHDHSYELLCAWFSGVEGADGVSIYVARLPPGSRRWEAAQLVASAPGASLQNPVWLRAPNDTIHLMFTKQYGMEQGTSNVMGVLSRDGGRHWSASPRVVMAEPGAFIKNAVLPAAAGSVAGGGSGSSWVLPMYHTPEGANKFPSQFSEVRRSVDGGATWGEASRMSELGEGLVQPSVVRAGSGQLVAFFRQRYTNDTARAFVWRSESSDDGRTWTAASPTPLPNPNKAVQAVVLHSGAILLIFNNNRGWALKARKENGRKTILDHKFHPVAAALSFDGGMTWPYVRDLEEEFDPKYEYSYPSVVQTSDGLIHVSYTWSQEPCRRCSIRYLRFTEDWVKGRWVWGSTRGIYQPPPTAAGSFTGGAGVSVERMSWPMGAAVAMVGMAVLGWAWHGHSSHREK